MGPSNLKKRVAKGSLILLVGNGTEQAVRFIRNMILARLLAPEVFGLMAIVLAVNGAVETFTDLGIRYAIVQNRHSEESALSNMAWYVSVTRSVVIYLVGFLLSPYIADFYKHPELTGLIRVALLCIIFNGAISINVHLALKKLQMKKWVLIQQGGGILGVATTLILALRVHSVWALVLGVVAEAVYRLVLSYALLPHFPRFHFDRQSFDELMSFSRGVFGLGFFYFLFAQADIFFIGKICSPFDLGLYSMAASLANVPIQTVSQLIDKVGMSAFSELQDDRPRLNRAVMKIMSLLVLLGFPVIGFVYVYGARILSIVYGPVYANVALPFTIITFSFLLRLTSVPIAQIYFASGKPGYHRNFTVLRATLILLLLYPLTRKFGLSGAAFAGILAMGTGLIIQVMKLRKVTGFDATALFGVVGKAMAVSLCIYLVLDRVNALTRPGWIGIVWGSVVFLLLYASIIWVFFARNRTNLSTSV